MILFKQHSRAWQIETGTRAEILRFASLPRGWHFGQGGPPSLGTIREALKVLDWGASLGLRTYAFPGVNDEVGLSFQGNDKTLEVVVGANGMSAAQWEADEGVEPVDVAAFGAVYSRLLDLVTGPQWRSQDSFIFVTSTQTKPSSSIWHSTTPVAEKPNQANP